MKACVIGHGPSPVGRGWGPMIDECDFVVRLFDCNWQNAADYGTRYDAGVVTMNERSLRWFEKEAVRKPKAWWFYITGPIHEVNTKIPAMGFMVSKDRNAALTMGVQRNRASFELTRGTAALCHVLRSLRPETCIAVGFDEVMRGQLMNNPYPAACVDAMAGRAEYGEIVNDLTAREGRTETIGHDYSVEAKVIHSAALEVGCKVVSASDWFEAKQLR